MINERNIARRLAEILNGNEGLIESFSYDVYKLSEDEFDILLNGDLLDTEDFLYNLLCYYDKNDLEEIVKKYLN